MRHSRRETLRLGLAGAGVAALPAGLAANSPVQAKTPTCPPTAPHEFAAGTRAWAKGFEGQRRADLGNGTYLNPVLSGDRPDPNVLKDGDDYYAGFSSFFWYPGIVLWHSKDLVNWTPFTTCLTQPIGSVWALDLVKHAGRYFIYIPVLDEKGDGGDPFKTFVIHADSMAGPWSDPIQLDIQGFAIDPGHGVGEDGTRYLFVNGGRRIRLTDDGLATVGELEHAYDAWPIPEDYIIEGVALEGPKVLHHDGWYYLFSGQGGTAGPPTSHMVVVCRARSIDGPWEQCPHNPIVRTETRGEPWWSRGHATAVEGPHGDWWLVYHGYENGFRTLGREMLLEPMEWTQDGWPRALGADLHAPLRKPLPASTGASALPLSTDFRNPQFGPHFTFFDPAPGYLERVRLGDGLTLTAQGASPAESSPMGMIAGDRSYEVTVDITLEGDAEAGLLLFYDTRFFCGVGADANGIKLYKMGSLQTFPDPGPGTGRTMSLRVRNVENVATWYISADRESWRKVISFEVSGYNHNMADGFMSLRPALYACSGASATFHHLEYCALPEQP